MKKNDFKDLLKSIDQARDIRKAKRKPSWVSKVGLENIDGYFKEKAGKTC